MEGVDTKGVKDDSLDKILMDLIGLLGQRAILPIERVSELLNRIVKNEKPQIKELNSGHRE